MGRLTRDPEVKYGETTTVAKYTIAVDRRFKKEGQQEADFFRCVSFGKQAEFVEKYLRKGTKIAIDGEIHIDQYTVDGKTRYSTEIKVDHVDFAESKKTQDEKPPADGFMQTDTDDDDLIPFK